MFHLTFCAQLGTKADWEKEHGGGENAQEKRGWETAGDRERKARIEKERERERERERNLRGVGKKASCYENKFQSHIEGR